MSILDRRIESQDHQIMPPVRAIATKFPEVQVYVVKLALPELSDSDLPLGWETVDCAQSGLSRLVIGRENIVENTGKKFSPNSMVISYATVGKWSREYVFSSAEDELVSTLGGTVDKIEKFQDGTVACICAGSYLSPQGIRLKVRYEYSIYTSKSGAVTWVVESVDTWANQTDRMGDEKKTKNDLAHISRINSAQLGHLLLN